MKTAVKDKKQTKNKKVDNAQNSSGIQQNQNSSTRSEVVHTPPPLDAEHVNQDKKSQKAFLEQHTGEIKKTEDLEPKDRSQLYAPKETEVATDELVASENFNDTKKGENLKEKDNAQEASDEANEEIDNDYEQYKKDTPILNKDDHNTNEIL